jgi:hypothetical protein
MQVMRQKGWVDQVDFRFYDLETADGLAEAAYHQLEGDLPAVIVEAGKPGKVISGEVLFQGAMVSLGDMLDFGVKPSLN